MLIFPAGPDCSTRVVQSNFVPSELSTVIRRSSSILCAVRPEPTIRLRFSVPRKVLIEMKYERNIRIAAVNIQGTIIAYTLTRSKNPAFRRRGGSTIGFLSLDAKQKANDAKYEVQRDCTSGTVPQNGAGM